MARLGGFGGPGSLPPTFQLLDSSGFDLKHTTGIPYPAIDPEGDLIPIVGITDSATSQSSWVIWSLAKKRAIFQRAGHFNDAYPQAYRPQFLFNPVKKEIVVAVPRPSNSKWTNIPTLFSIFRLDADSGQIKGELEIEGLWSLMDISPDGNKLLLTATHWTGWSITYEGPFQPIILDLETGNSQRENIIAETTYFETDEKLIVLLFGGVYRYDLKEHRFLSDAVYRIRRDARGREAELLLTASSWKSPMDGRIGMRIWPFTDSDREKKGLTRFEAESCALSFFVVPAKYSNGLPIEIGSSGKFYHYRTDTRTSPINTKRNVILIHAEKRQGEFGSFLSNDWFLVEFGTEKMHLIKSVPQGDGFMQCRFVNQDLVAAWDNKAIRFFHIDDLLLGGMDSPWTESD